MVLDPRRAAFVGYLTLCAPLALLAVHTVAQAQPPRSGDKVATRTVLVTGEGLDPEKAELSAVLQAVHQVVGLYVDAKQVLEDDKLSEEILTFANGRIYSAKRVTDPERNDDGLWRVEMRVSVVVTDLKALLKKRRFEVADIPGEEIAEKIEIEKKRQAFQAELDKKAALSLGALLDQLSIADMLTPADNVRWRDDGGGNIAVTFQLQPDLEQWSAYRQRLEMALRKASGDGRPVLFAVGPITPAGRSNVQSDNTKGFDFMGQLNGKRSQESKRLVESMKALQIRNKLDHGYYLGILRGLEVGNDPKMRTKFVWAVYPTPRQLVDDLKDSQVKPVKVVITLADESGDAIADTEAPLEEVLDIKSSKKLLLFHCDDSINSASLALAAPFPWIDHVHGLAVVRAEPYTVNLPVDAADVARVAKVVVHLE